MFAGRKFAAFLFDMDGTIINSIAAAERVWAEWAHRHGLDVAAFLPTIHGKRAVETISALELPGVDPVFEAEALLKAEAADLDGIVAIAGAVAFLNSLPPERWAIATSAPRELALLRMKAAGVPVPNVRFFAARFNFKPRPWLEVGLTRTAQWCGGDRACDWGTFVDMVLGNDNQVDDGGASAEQPGNQMAGYDLRLRLPHRR